MATWMERLKENTPTELREMVAKAKETRKRMTEKMEKQVGQVKTSVETIGSGALAGYARGRMEDPADEDSYKVPGIKLPYDIALGVATKAAAFTVGGKAEEDLHAVSNGLLTVGLGFLTYDMGAKARVESLEGKPADTSAGRPTRSGRRASLPHRSVEGPAAARARARAERRRAAA